VLLTPATRSWLLSQPGEHRRNPGAGPTTPRKPLTDRLSPCCHWVWSVPSPRGGDGLVAVDQEQLLSGNDPAKWNHERGPVGAAGEVRPGCSQVCDENFSGNQRNLHTTFGSRPARGSARSRSASGGADQLAVDGRGTCIRSVGQTVVSTCPVIYQQSVGKLNNRFSVTTHPLPAPTAGRDRVGSYDAQARELSSIHAHYSTSYRR